MKGLTRKQVADTAGVTIEAVRFYEREGIIQEPPRTEAGYRQYPQEAIIRIRSVKRAQSLGFSLPEIRELLSLRLSPDTSVADIHQQALRKIVEIDAKIRTLQQMKRTLKTLTEACQGEGTLSDCPILASLDSSQKRTRPEKEENAMKRKIEIFSAGCPKCQEAITQVRSLACSSCEIEVLDMQQETVAIRAKQYGIQRVPAVVIDGQLAGCCGQGGVDEAVLRAAGIGSAS